MDLGCVSGWNSYGFEWVSVEFEWRGFGFGMDFDRFGVDLLRCRTDIGGLGVGLEWAEFRWFGTGLDGFSIYSNGLGMGVHTDWDGFGNKSEALGIQLARYRQRPGNIKRAQSTEYEPTFRSIWDGLG